MLLFLRRFGTSEATDGTLGAYSVYVLVTVFAQGARISGAALIGGPRPRVEPSDFAWALAAIATALPLALWALHVPVARVVASTDDAVSAAEAALPVLGLGMAAQFAAVAWATIIGIRGQLVIAAGALALGGVAALVGFVVLVPSQDESALAWATVFSGCTACAVMAVVLRPAPRRHPPHASRMVAAVAALLRENLVPMFSTTLYVVSIAVAAQIAHEPGEVSLFALAFLAASYVCGILGTASAIVDTVLMSSASAGLAQGLSAVVTRGVAASFGPATVILGVASVTAPAAVALIAPEQAGATDPRWLGAYLVALLPFTYATLTTNLAFSAWFTTGRGTELNRPLALALLGHVVVTIGLGKTLGVTGVALGAGATTAAFAAVALRPAQRLGGVTLLEGFRQSSLGVAAFVPPWLVLGRPGVDEPVAAGVAAATATSLCVLVMLWRRGRYGGPKHAD
jgi:hypothetical protein